MDAIIRKVKETGNYNFVTSTNGARDILSKYSVEQLEEIKRRYMAIK